MKILGVCGSPNTKSKTLLAVTAAVEHACAANSDVVGNIINICEHEVDFCRGAETSGYGSGTNGIVDAMCAADALVVGTPIYRGSYTGILKNIFDILPNDALQGKPVALIGTGGTDHHFLAVERELAPLVAFFDALIVPGCVYAKNDDYADDAIASDRLVEDLRRMADALVTLTRSVPSGFRGARPPDIPRRSLQGAGGR